MLTFSPINQKMYLEVATEITYHRLFPLIMEDFVTRVDMALLLSAANLIVTGTAGPAPVAATIQPIQNGSDPTALSQALKISKEAKKKTGEFAVKGALGALGDR